MKRGILSIIIGCIGFYMLYRFHNNLYQEFITINDQQQNTSQSISDLFSFQKLCKIVLISIALLSLYLGVISFLKKYKVGMIGIILAVLLLIFSFIPFWKYFLDDGISINYFINL